MGPEPARYRGGVVVLVAAFFVPFILVIVGVLRRHAAPMRLSQEKMLSDMPRVTSASRWIVHCSCRPYRPGPTIWGAAIGLKRIAETFWIEVHGDVANLCLGGGAVALPRLQAAVVA